MIWACAVCRIGSRVPGRAWQIAGFTPPALCWRCNRDRHPAPAKRGPRR